MTILPGSLDNFSFRNTPGIILILNQTLGMCWRAVWTMTDAVDQCRLLKKKCFRLRESYSNVSNYTILFSPDMWYVLMSGSDREGCGRSVEFPCETLLYLLQQVNWTHEPPELHIVTDKSLTIDQQTAVSTGFIYYLSLLDKWDGGRASGLCELFSCLIRPIRFLGI